MAEGDLRTTSQIDRYSNWVFIKVGNKIEIADPTTTTRTYTFKEGATTSFVLLATYSDAVTKLLLVSIERTT